jgi:hypothetical protein
MAVSDTFAISVLEAILRFLLEEEEEEEEEEAADQEMPPRKFQAAASFAPLA